MMGKWLRFKGDNNTRDLGGCPACNGKIVASGRLIRSGELSKMNLASVCLLEDWYHVHTFVDLRTSGEQRRRPVPLSPSPHKSKLVHIPILKQAMQGITKDDSSMKEKMDALMAAGLSEQEFMQQCYWEMVSDPAAMDGYRQLFDILLESSEGAVVFFCSHGRDRTGIASMLILTALGVSEDVIRQDYLLSPKKLVWECRGLRVLKFFHILTPEQANFAAAWLMPDAMRFDNTFNRIKEKYGSLERYLEVGIGVSRYEQTVLRELYLTDG